MLDLMEAQTVISNNDTFSKTIMFKPGIREQSFGRCFLLTAIFFHIFSAIIYSSYFIIQFLRLEKLASITFRNCQWK